MARIQSTPIAPKAKHLSNKLRDSARGQQCAFQLPGHLCNPETVVLCHAPSHLKGMGNKSPDFWAVYGCAECHAEIDNHKVPDEHKVWMRAILKTWLVMIETGLITITKTNPKAKAHIRASHLMKGSVQ